MFLGLVHLLSLPTRERRWYFLYFSSKIFREDLLLDHALKPSTVTWEMEKYRCRPGSHLPLGSGCLLYGLSLGCSV